MSLWLTLVSPAYAQSIRAPRMCDFDEFVVGIFDKMWPFIGMALLGMFIYGGVMWMLSSGDPQRISKATSTFLWALVGVVILAMLMVVMGTFEELFGLGTGSLRIFTIDCT